MEDIPQAMSAIVLRAAYKDELVLENPGFDKEQVLAC